MQRIPDPSQQSGGYMVHPAVLEASTQTAAVFAATAGPEDSQITRIPAALDAFCPPADAAGADSWCSGTLEGVLPTGTVVTSFSLAAGSSAVAARLTGFQAKVVRPQAIAASAPLQYRIVWQAQEAAPPLHAASPVNSHTRKSGKVHWLVSGPGSASSKVFRMPKGKALRPAHDAAQSIALLQHEMQQSAAGSSLQLLTHGSVSFPAVADMPGMLLPPSQTIVRANTSILASQLKARVYAAAEAYAISVMC